MDTPSPWLLKLIGAVAGSIGGLIFRSPKNIRDALGKFCFSILCGALFWFVPVDFFDWPDSPDHMLAGAAAMSFAGWPVAELALRLIRSKTK